MNISRRLLFVMMAVLAMTLLLAMPVMAQQPSQNQSPIPQPSDPPQQTPNVRDQAVPSRENPVQPPDDLGVPGNPTRAQTSWGIPLLTLIVGYAIGYMVGMSRRATPSVDRRNPAA